MRAFLKGLFIAVAAVLSLFFLVGILAVIFSGPRVPDNSVLHIELSGEIPERPASELASMLAETSRPALVEVVHAVRAAADDPRIVGLLLTLVRSEVALAQVQEIEEAMEAFRATGKPTLCHTDTAGELGRGNAVYALAVTADKVMLSPPADLNIVGLHAVGQFLKGTMEKLGVHPYFARRHEYKNAPNRLTESGYTATHREVVKALVDDLQRDLLAHVAARRRVKPEQAGAWLAGGPYPARTALDKGLIDELGYRDEAEAEIRTLSGSQQKPFVPLREYLHSVHRNHGGARIAMILGDGTIYYGKGPTSPFSSSGELYSHAVAEGFRNARKDHVRGILFRVNSPGGSYVGSDVVRREVELTREHGIPVVVSMGQLAASGGYFVSMDADAIVAHPSTLTGSIGVYAGWIATRKAWQDWLGITFDTYKGMENADHFWELEYPTQSRRKATDKVVDRIYEDFVTRVAKARGKSHDEAHAIAKGRVWSGRAALGHGLVDELGGMDTALTRLRTLAKIPPEEEVTLVVYPEPTSLVEDLIEFVVSVKTGAQTLHRVAAQLGYTPHGGVLQMPHDLDIE